MTDAVEETTEGSAVTVAEEVKTDNQGRKLLMGAFSFVVPDGHPEQGNKIEKTFEYTECIDDAQAVATLKERKWKLREIINDKLKSGARSNSYQNSLMPYRQSQVSQEDIRLRVIRDMIRSGIPEALATELFDSGVAKAKAAK